MNQPFSIILNDSQIKMSFFPEGDACLTVEGRDYRINKDQVEVLRTILNNLVVSFDDISEDDGR